MNNHGGNRPGGFGTRKRLTDEGIKEILNNYSVMTCSEMALILKVKRTDVYDFCRSNNLDFKRFPVKVKKESEYFEVGKRLNWAI